MTAIQLKELPGLAVLGVDQMNGLLIVHDSVRGRTYRIGFDSDSGSEERVVKLVEVVARHMVADRREQLLANLTTAIRNMPA